VDVTFSAQEVLTMVNKIQEMLHDNNLDAHWNEALDSWEKDEVAKVQDRVTTAREWVNTRKEQLLSSITDVKEDEDANLAFALWFIELKSHWLMLNTQMNYQLFQKGAIDLDIHYKGAMISHLMGAFEPLIREEDQVKISEFLMTPSPVAS